jgi:hypothetical protein
VSTTSVRQRDEIAGPLGHLHRLAIAQQLHHLHQLHLERLCLCPRAGQRRHRRLDPLDRARMVRAPDIDQLHRHFAFWK